VSDHSTRGQIWERDYESWLTTIKGLREALQTVEDRLEAALNLHNPLLFFDRGQACETCNEDWPCRTFQALTGHEVTT